jgi:hypothetical protein
MQKEKFSERHKLVLNVRVEKGNKGRYKNFD